MIDFLKERIEGVYSRPWLRNERLTELQALKELAQELSGGARVHWSDGAEIEVWSQSQGFTEPTRFKGTIREMSVLSNVVFYHINAQKLDRIAELKHELSDQFSDASVVELAMIQKLKEALPMFTGSHGRFVLFVVLALGITEERDLAAASRLSLDDLFAVIEFRQETGKSLAQVAEELTT